MSLFNEDRNQSPRSGSAFPRWARDWAEWPRKRGDRPVFQQVRR